MVRPNLFTSVWPRHNRYSAEFDVPTTLSLNITVLWDVRPCLWASTCLRFDISYWLCLQNRWIMRPGRNMALITHLHLAPSLRKEYSCTYTPPLGFYVLFWGEIWLLLCLYIQGQAVEEEWCSVGPLVEKQKDFLPPILRGLLAQGRSVSSVSSQRPGIFKRQVLLTKHFHLYVALCCKQCRRKVFW